MDEKEVMITGPVKIMHPLDNILLPYIEGEDAGQVYEIRARGGSGTYIIKTVDPQVASAQDLSFVKSRGVGVTSIKVMDE